MTTLEKTLKTSANKILISLSASISQKKSIEIYVGLLVHKIIKFIFLLFQIHCLPAPPGIARASLIAGSQYVAFWTPSSPLAHLPGQLRLQRSL